MIEWHPTQWLDTVPSTQRWIQEIRPLLLDTIVAAHHQSSGLGTHGRSWESHPGDLTFSFGFLARDEGLNHLLFSVSLAIWDALMDESIVIKPPNDLYLNDAKLGGILIENKTVERTPVTWVGLGVNLIEKSGGQTPASHIRSPQPPHDYIERFKEAFNQRMGQTKDQLFNDYHAKIPWDHLIWQYQGHPISPESLLPDMTVQWGEKNISLSHMTITYKQIDTDHKTHD